MIAEHWADFLLVLLFGSVISALAFTLGVIHEREKHDDG